MTLIQRFMARRRPTPEQVAQEITQAAVVLAEDVQDIWEEVMAQRCRAQSPEVIEALDQIRFLCGAVQKFANTVEETAKGVR